MKRKFVILTDPKRRGHTTPPGTTPTQELPVSVRRQTERGKCEQDPLLWFPGEGTARQANRFRIG